MGLPPSASESVCMCLQGGFGLPCKVRCCFMLFKNCSGDFWSMVLSWGWLCFCAVMCFWGFVCFVVPPHFRWVLGYLVAFGVFPHFQSVLGGLVAFWGFPPFLIGPACFPCFFLYFLCISDLPPLFSVHFWPAPFFSMHFQWVLHTWLLFSPALQPEGIDCSYNKSCSDFFGDFLKFGLIGMD